MLMPGKSNSDSQKNSPDSNNMISQMKKSLTKTTRTPVNKKINKKTRYSTANKFTVLNRNKNRQFDLTIKEHSPNDFDSNKIEDKLNLSLNLKKIDLDSLNLEAENDNLTFISMRKNIKKTVPPPTSGKVSDEIIQSLDLTNSLMKRNPSVSDGSSAFFRKKKKINSKIVTKNISIRNSFSSVTSLSEESFTKLSSQDEYKKRQEDENQDYIVGFFLGIFFNIFGVLLICCQKRKKKRIEGAVHGAVISGLVILFLIHTVCVHNFLNDSNEIPKDENLNQINKDNSENVETKNLAEKVLKLVL